MLVPLLVLAVALVMMFIERATPGRAWPRVAGWWTRALVLNGFQAVSLLTLGRFLDPHLQHFRPWSLEGLSTVEAVALGYVLHSFIYYWWHRWRHEVGFLWRWIHQIHHSPQRIEIITSFYKHPVEILLNGVLSSVVLLVVLGLSPEAATGVFLVSGLAELVYHWNVKTPQWLGYLIQRPENHCVHHQQGLHAFNYGDLPIFDMLFGTFRNPKTWDLTCGLGAENEPKLIEMLVGADVLATPALGPTPGTSS